MVNDNEDGLLCDGCLVWRHRECLSMGWKNFQKISKSTQEWICSSCVEKGKKPKQSVSNYTIDDVMEALKGMERKYDVLFQKYEEQVKINEELKLELSNIKCQLNVRDQKELANNIIVYGVPYKTNENLQQLVNKVGSVLQVELDSNFTAFRVGAREDGRRVPIKITFKNEDLKKRLMKSPRRYNLDARVLGFADEHRLYLNHDLTKHNLDLFKKAQVFRKENDFKYLWFSGGSILLKKKEDSRVIVVRGESDLKN